MVSRPLVGDSGMGGEVGYSVNPSGNGSLCRSGVYSGSVPVARRKAHTAAAMVAGTAASPAPAGSGYSESSMTTMFTSGGVFHCRV